MKGKLMLVLMGAAFLMPQESTAQRVRDRVRTRTRPAPTTVSGRLSGCHAPARAIRLLQAGRLQQLQTVVCLEGEPSEGGNGLQSYAAFVPG